jgi:SAM-dependent methyltransferase
MQIDHLDTTPFEAFEAAGWERQAAGYDAFFRAVTTSAVGPLLDAAGVRRGSQLLDVGSGPGYVAGAAAERGADATGIDIAGTMVAIARQAWPGARFRQGDAHALPFPDRSFDAVTAGFAILHLGRPECAVAEMVRVLMAGGRVAVTVWDQPDRVPLLGAVAAALATCGADAPADIPAGPPFFRFSQDDELRGLLIGCGLDDVTVETLHFVHEVRDAGVVWDGIMEGTVRTSALVVRQPKPIRRRIRAAFVEHLEMYRMGSVLELPVSVKLGVGTAPGRT